MDNNSLNDYIFFMEEFLRFLDSLFKELLFQF